MGKLDSLLQTIRKGADTYAHVQKVAVDPAGQAAMHLARNLLGFRATTVGGKGGKRKVKRALGRKGGRQGKRKGGRKGVSLDMGGQVVESANAPVAFARTGQIKTALKTFKGEALDGLGIHTVELPVVGGTGDDANLVKMGASGAFELNQQYQLNPISSTTFPQMAPVANLYKKFKLKQLKVHYVHTCPTAQAGRVVIGFSPDPDFTPPTSCTEIIRLSNSASGAAYEDFSLSCNLDGIQKDWQYCSNESDDADVRLEQPGVIFVASDGNNSDAAADVGNLYIEAAFEFVDREDLGLLASSIVYLMRRLRCKKTLSVDDKLRVLAGPVREFFKEQKKMERGPDEIDKLINDTLRAPPIVDQSQIVSRALPSSTAGRGGFA